MSPTPALRTSAPRLEQLLNAEPVDFAALAGELMARGMAAEAALCHSWSLLPPSAELWWQKRRRWMERIGGLEVEAEPGPVAAVSEPGEAAVAAELEAIQALLEGGELAAACGRITRLSHAQQLSPHLCNRAAMLHTRLGDCWEAERWYRTSLVQLGAQPQCWFALANLLLRQQAWDEALEAATVGLQLEAAHPWGLKLRQHALVGLRADQTLRQLAGLGHLAFPLDAQEPADAVGFDALAHDVASAPLPHKLLLQGLLRPGPQQDEPLLIWCVGPASHRILVWLAAQRLLPPSTQVQVFADPDADLCSLPESERGLVIAPSLPLYQLRQQEQAPQLTVLAPLQAAAWPLLTARLIERATPLLLDGRCDLALPRHRLLLQTPHWQLWAAAAG